MKKYKYISGSEREIERDGVQFMAIIQDKPEKIHMKTTWNEHSKIMKNFFDLCGQYSNLQRLNKPKQAQVHRTMFVVLSRVHIILSSTQMLLQ